jgi:hypothetical protein
MIDRDLLDLMEVVREIPKEHWELLTFIRQMPRKDLERLRDLVEREDVPLADFPTGKSQAPDADAAPNHASAADGPTYGSKTDLTLGDLKRFL